ncbi:MAG: glycosyltransferase family 2 protein [Candidatus Hodarchaeales archaeon]
MWIYRLLSKVGLVISLIIFVIIPIYAFISLSWIFKTTSLISILLNIFVLIIEEIGLAFALYLFYMIYGAFTFRIENKKALNKTMIEPFFTIIIPSHGTPFTTIKDTLEGAMKLDYEKYEIIVSDNGQDPIVTEKLEEFCKAKNIPFYHKDDSRGFKAGNINAVLDKALGDYIIILDSDHIPVSDLLKKLSKFINEEREKGSGEIAFIQAKVAYRNTNRLYQKANSILYSQFYEVFEAAKDNRGMVLFNGSTGCFKTDILKQYGGFSEETLIEDIDTSMKILIDGYKGRYLNAVGSYGLVPETAKDQVSQLWRWAHGACSILRLRMRKILFSKLGLLKKAELILNAMAFFSGICIVALMGILSIMIILKVDYLRPVFLGIHLGYLMPTLVGISFSISAFLAILWEERNDPLISRLFQLIPFYLFSLGAFLFVISGVIEGLLLKNTPLGEGSVWNREIHALRNSVIALLFCGLMISIGFYGVINGFSAGFGWFIISGVLTWVLAPIILIWEEVFPPIKKQ